jgi:hypothetical protein
MLEPPFHGAVQATTTLNPEKEVTGTVGLSGICAAKMVRTEDSTL